MRSFKSCPNFMQQALDMAEGGRGFTYPNPLVGAILVKNGKILSRGYHQTFGGPHAEVEAIRKARGRSAGSDLYVTLEPCSTYGKTPPCTAQIIKAGVRRVIIAVKDPNPVHSGRGIRELKTNGIRVATGVLRKDAIRQNEAFFKWMRTGLPFVTLKMAQTLDGKIATREGKSRWITGRKARSWVHHLRGENQAVLIGKRTALLDDPRLFSGAGALQPVRIVLDRKLEIPMNRKVFSSFPERTLAVCQESAYKERYSRYNRKGIGLLAVGVKNGKLDLCDLLTKLGKMGIISVLVEGGGETAANFVERRLVDKVFFFIAPKILGGREALTSVEGHGITDLMKAISVRDVRISQKGEDILFEGYPVYKR